MKKPLVSVVMPAYNTEKYISAAIDSILNQTFSDFELLVLNDSPDNKELEKIVKNYAKYDKRIMYYKNKKNIGVTKSRNKLLTLAHGKYIACMDSDDISLPTRFEKQVKYMEKHPECGVLGTWYKMFENGNTVIKNPHYVKMTDLLIGSCVGNPTAMIRKSIIDTYELNYDNAYNWCEDYEFWSRLIFITEIHNLPEVLLNYRWYGNNVSIVHSKKQQKLANRVKQNILDKITNVPQIQNIIMDCVQNNAIKTGFLLPKWAGKIICSFIFKKETRCRFRNRYVKD